MNDDYDYLYKVVLLGDQGVGKSNILSRLTRDVFNHDSKSTIGVEFATKSIVIDGTPIKAQIWDTAGQERYRSITKAYYKGSIGALLVFDLTRIETLHNCEQWLDELRTITAADIPLILVGNKADLEAERTVPEKIAEIFADGQGLKYIETSALTGDNIGVAFESLMRDSHKKSIERLTSNNRKDALPKATPVKLLDRNKNNAKCAC